MTEIVNVKAIDKLLADVEKDGDKFILSADATEKIVAFELALAMMQEADAMLRQKVTQALQKFGGKSFRGKGGLVISMVAERERYAVEPDKKKFLREVIKYVPDDEAIDKFIERNKRLPAGVSIIKSAPSIRMKLGKTSDIDEERN